MRDIAIFDITKEKFYIYSDKKLGVFLALTTGALLFSIVLVIFVKIFENSNLLDNYLEFFMIIITYPAYKAGYSIYNNFFKLFLVNSKSEKIDSVYRFWDHDIIRPFIDFSKILGIAVDCEIEERTYTYGNKTHFQKIFCYYSVMILKNGKKILLTVGKGGEKGFNTEQEYSIKAAEIYKTQYLGGKLQHEIAYNLNLFNFKRKLKFQSCSKFIKPLKRILLLLSLAFYFFSLIAIIIYFLGFYAF